MAPEYAILIDFEATADSSDDELTRLAQCDHHEIIEFVRSSEFHSTQSLEPQCHLPFLRARARGSILTRTARNCPRALHVAAPQLATLTLA